MNAPDCLLFYFIINNNHHNMDNRSHIHIRHKSTIIPPYPPYPPKAPPSNAPAANPPRNGKPKPKPNGLPKPKPGLRSQIPKPQPEPPNPPNLIHSSFINNIRKLLQSLFIIFPPLFSFIILSFSLCLCTIHLVCLG